MTLIPPSTNNEPPAKSTEYPVPQASLPRLGAEDVDTFLEYLFTTVARRPQRLRLRETAGVARYLKALALQSPRGKARSLVDQLADVIWGMLFQYGDIEPASKKAVVASLERHLKTYLAGLDAAIGLAPALALIQQSPPPYRGAEAFKPPTLMSRQLSMRSHGRTRLVNDLTERIYVGYHALRRSGIRDARGRITVVLNKLGMKPRSRKGTVSEWLSCEVYERVRQYETRVKESLSEDKDRDAKIRERRNYPVDFWLDVFQRRRPVVFVRTPKEPG